MRKLNVKDPNVFNEWRSLYGELTNEEHLQFIEDCAKEFTVQRHFNSNFFSQFFNKLTAPRVMEIGGWQGELAEHCLKHHDIANWDNFEVCKTAIDRTVCQDKRYRPRHQTEFDWFKAAHAEGFDVVVSSNTIEHLNADHLMLLMEHVRGIPKILIEAPLIKPGETWNGYWGTHILELTWPQVISEFSAIRYAHTYLGPDCVLFEKLP